VKLNESAAYTIIPNLKGVQASDEGIDSLVIKLFVC